MIKRMVIWAITMLALGESEPVDIKGILAPQAGTGDLGMCQVELLSQPITTTVNSGGPFQLTGVAPIADHSGKSAFQINNGLFTFSLDAAKEVQFTLFDLQGKSRYQSGLEKRTAGTYQLDLTVIMGSVFTPGVYNLRVKIGNEVYQFSFPYGGNPLTTVSASANDKHKDISTATLLKRSQSQAVDTLSILCKGYNPKRVAIDNYIVDLDTIVIKKTNIIHMMLDEIGYYEMSNMGHPDIKTPNVDLMADQGIKFSQALAGSAVCAPTRCALMTGLHMGNCAYIANAPNETIRDNDETIAEVLKREGYATGGFGKWGMGDIGSPGVPENQGFDIFYGYYNQVHAHTFFPTYLVRNGVTETLPGNTGDKYVGETYSQDLIFEETKTFLEENKDKPFFLYLPYTPPHGQWGIPGDNEYWLKYEDLPWNAGQSRAEDSRVYAAMIEMVDAQLGELLQMLKDFGIDENTMVIFSGDNGGQYYFDTDKVTNEKNWPRGFFGPNDDPNSDQYFRGQKTELYEGGLRIPMVIRWPGVIASGQVSDLLWYFPDFLTTYADIAGGTMENPHDGISIYPTLAGEKIAGGQQTQHEYLYWEWPGDWQAVRMENWKYHKKGNGSEELYDLDTDISEANNLAAEPIHANILAQMRAYAVDSKR